MILKAGERSTERLGSVHVTFEGVLGPDFDMTDGQLITALQRGTPVDPGTRVRIAHYDDARNWFEVVAVIEVVARRAAVA